MVSNVKPWEDLIKNLTEEEVITVLTTLGSAKPNRDKDNNLVFQSVCHGSQSWKLCYYIKTKNFFCYKEWESFNIFTLVMQVKDFDFRQAFKFVCDLIGYNVNNSPTVVGGFFNSYSKEDWDMFEKYSTYSFLDSKKVENKIYNENILNLYDNLYYEGWIEENISISTMQKFNIKYSKPNNQIIIPHYDINNNLIGIRGRNLDSNAFAKYCPVRIQEDWYTHSLSENLYGLNKNQILIKKLGKVLICESEKSVMQCETFFPNSSFTVACCGSNISLSQIKLLIDLGVKEVQLGMDFDYHEMGFNIEYLTYKEKILGLAKKLVPYFSVYCVTSYNQDTVRYKNSPTDFSKELLISMMKKKVLITDKTIEKELPIVEQQLENIMKSCKGVNN